MEGEVEDFSDAEEMHVERKAKELLKKQQEDAKLEKDELEVLLPYIYNLLSIRTFLLDLSVIKEVG